MFASTERGEKMSDRTQRAAERAASVINAVSDPAKLYLAGVADGMAAATDLGVDQPKEEAEDEAEKEGA